MQILDDGTLLIQSEIEIPSIWKATDLTGVYRLTLQPCNHRRFSYSVPQNKLTVKLHCLLELRDCSTQDCITCKRTNETRDLATWIRPTLKTPSIKKRITTYVTALKEWKKAGKPIRSDEEVLRIFEVFCDKCKSHKKNRCLFCGCRVAINGYPITNKIKMATEHCPKELW